MSDVAGAHDGIAEALTAAGTAEVLTAARKNEEQLGRVLGQLESERKQLRRALEEAQIERQMLQSAVEHSDMARRKAQACLKEALARAALAEEEAAAAHTETRDLRDAIADLLNAVAVAQEALQSK